MYKYATCIIRYQSNNQIVYDTTLEGGIAIDIMQEYLKKKPTVIDETGKELKIKKINGFYYQEDKTNASINNITTPRTYNTRLFNNIVEGAILYNINEIFARFIDKLKSIKSITIDPISFQHYLKTISIIMMKLRIF